MSSRNLDSVNAYYDAWRSGDFSRLAFTDDFSFVGPIDRFASAADFLATCVPLSRMVQAIHIQKQFALGDDICSIYDFVTSTPAGTIATAEWITLRNGKLAQIRLFYDASELRKLMAGMNPA